MASSVHVFTEGWQPFTRFADAGTDHIVQINPRKIFRCDECRDWRWAKWLKVQAYYDGWRLQCADGCYGENRNHRKLAVPPAAPRDCATSDVEAARNNENEKGTL